MINTTIQNYKIVRLIGEGGMASVYEGKHVMLGTKVAIKVLNPYLSTNEEIKKRFRDEAKLMASLDHPNITKVIEFDEQPQRLSIIMEFLSGEDLDQKIKRGGPLSNLQITEVFAQILSALQYAHERGVLHRDIKPSNIFILSDNRVKILDFGIAKLFGQGNEKTKTGTQIGTPVYMSPEQVTGDKSIDHRSDIYSLGVTMFYAINGKPPYDAEAESQFEIFTKIVNNPLPPFSAESKFKNLVICACNKNRAQRFQTCDEWLGELMSKDSTHVQKTERADYFEKNNNYSKTNNNSPESFFKKNKSFVFFMVLLFLSFIVFSVIKTDNKPTEEITLSADSIPSTPVEAEMDTKKEEENTGLSYNITVDQARDIYSKFSNAILNEDPDNLRNFLSPNITSWLGSNNINREWVIQNWQNHYLSKWEILKDEIQELRAGDVNGLFNFKKDYSIRSRENPDDVRNYKITGWFILNSDGLFENMNDFSTTRVYP
jgi:serine/threonine protein kinase